MYLAALGTLLCKIQFHDWRLSNCGSHVMDGFYEIGWEGFQCRRCSRRKIKKTGGEFWPRDCAVGAWQNAIQWQNKEITK